MGTAPQQDILREIAAFFGIPVFRINLDTDIIGYCEADEVDIKELLWMMEEKYQVELHLEDLLKTNALPIERIVVAIDHYRVNNKFSGGNMMSELLRNKIAVVTGASTGIGREISLILAREGAKVALIGRRKGELEKTKALIADLGSEAEIFEADLRSEAAAVGKEISSKFKAVDIIVNVAGVWHDADNAYYGPRLWEIPDEQVLEVMEVGILAPLLLTKSLLPGMIKKGRGGKVLNISGTFENGAKGWLHYYVSKKAIEAFTDGLSQELRKHKIQVNAISPSDTYTDAYKKFYPDEPSSGCMDPKDIARLALALVTDDFDFITGQVVIARNKNAACED